MYGTDFSNIIGISDFLISGHNPNQNAFFFFQAMFAATAVTIVSGAVAERIKFNGYLLAAIIITSLIYPIFGHWAWSPEGWLSKLGFIDFAGSTVVHSVGAWLGLAGAIVIGPRIGKFRKGEIKLFSPSNYNFIVFGTFVLFFAWFGFNAGSLLKFDSNASLILLNTLISGMFGGLGGWLICIVFKRKVDVETFAFSVIAGLVGITAGCNLLDTTSAAFVGFISSIVMALANYILLTKLKIDDPLNVVGVHGFAGAWGTIAVGIFAPLPENITRFEFISIQSLGIFSAFVFAFVAGLGLFFMLAKLNLLRVTKKHEVLGLNMSEHNAKQPWIETIESIIKIMRTGDINTKVYEERYTEVGLVAKFFNYLLNVLREKEILLTHNNRVLKKKAEIDPLTQIYNRGALVEKMHNLNPYNKNLSVIVIDIDKFKTINDTFGHHIGDVVLKELATLISSSVRSEDIVARWGGEEFVAVIKTKVLNEAEAIANKIRKDVEKYEFNTVKNLTISLGATSPRNKNENFELLFKRADKALYQAKELGRNRVCSW